MRFLPSFHVLLPCVVGVGVHPPPWGLFLTRPDTCYQEGKMKGQIFRVTGVVVWTLGNPPPSQTLTWLQLEMQGDRGRGWLTVGLLFAGGPAVAPWELPLSVACTLSSAVPLCRALLWCLSIRLGVETQWAQWLIISEVGVERSKGESFPLPTADVHFVVWLSSWFLRAHLALDDQV